MRRHQDISLFLCGDLMAGRGVDQIMAHPSQPRLFEPSMHSAEGYVALAERASGPIPRSADPTYIWGDLLPAITAADRRIVNLETAVTTHDTPWPKGINYRMHPNNLTCLTVAKVDLCVLANNHVLDWGRAGLAETLASLRQAGIATVGAGSARAEAERPAGLTAPGSGRVLVFAYGLPSSGIPAAWAAGEARSGVNFLPDLSLHSADRVATLCGLARRPGDIVVVSLHWGGNWGFEVSAEETAFARRLIEGGADLVHGHSSHHIKGIEVYRQRLILYGCGDFLDDYEGIGGSEAFRDDLSFAYFPRLGADGRLLELSLIPTRNRRFQVNRAHGEDRDWLVATLNREGRRFGTGVKARGEALLLRW